MAIWVVSAFCLNNVVMNVCGQVFACTYGVVLLGIYLGGKLLDSVVLLYLTFGETAKLFLKQYTILHFHHQYARSFVSLYPRYCLPFYFSRPSECEVISLCGIDFQFPDD